MNYEETLKYLYDFAPMFQQVGSKAYKEGMENSFLIDKHLNHPHKSYKTIHVGGTNGKGSTSHLLASILQEAGYKVGLYTSPHLLDFRERIRVNGEMIEKEYIVDFVKGNKDFFESIQPSFFELTTGMAFAYFADKGVDIAVIEVGLGGRLDCTNVILPILSIITNIGFDHTNLLGDSLSKIAFEKAGIIKPGIPVVIGESHPETDPVFLERAGELQNKDIYFADKVKPIQESKLLPSGYWEFETKKYPELIDELGGFAQEKNAATVLVAIDILSGTTIPIPPKAVYKGFRYVIENTGLTGRWQKIQNDPEIIFDTGHNVDGIKYIAKQLISKRYDRLHIVFGMVNDKDCSSVLELLPKNAIYYFTRASIARALPSEELAKLAGTFGLKGEIYPDVKEAFLTAKHQANKKDLIFVGGSTFVVADALAVITNEDDEITLN
ncbi:bifunctional folylpolyglutamate synthase/dihydrofolate synthase [Bacteroidales bacterium OttesenSCG-928-A17]|nr:bifunctional folylpolyglutamate synthase/dihydrofolate synthase [Bacteroidales bacterium OttesenSCG-928-A17]